MGYPISVNRYVPRVANGGRGTYEKRLIDMGQSFRCDTFRFSGFSRNGDRNNRSRGNPSRAPQELSARGFEHIQPPQNTVLNENSLLARGEVALAGARAMGLCNHWAHVARKAKPSTHMKITITTSQASSAAASRVAVGIRFMCCGHGPAQITSQARVLS